MSNHIPSGRFGRKTRVRPGDVLLYCGENVQAVEVELGKYIIARSLFNTRTRFIIEWDSMTWKRDPHFLQNIENKEREEKRLKEFLTNNGLPSNPPYRWSTEYSSYKAEKKRLLEEYKEMKSGSKKKKKKKHQNQVKKQIPTYPLPRNSIFDDILIQVPPTNDRPLKRGVNDPYTDRIIYNNADFLEKLSHQEYVSGLSGFVSKEQKEQERRIQRQKMKEQQEKQKRNSIKNVKDWQNENKKKNRRAARFEKQEDNNKNIPAGDNELAETWDIPENIVSWADAWEDVDPYDWSKIDDLSENVESNYQVGLVVPVEDDFDENDERFNIANFQVPSLYSNSNDGSSSSSVHSYNIQSSYFHDSVNSSFNYSLSDKQRQIIEANDRIDHCEDIFYAPSSTHQQVNRNSDDLFNFFSSDDEEDEETPNVSSSSNSFYFDMSKMVQSSQKIHYFEDIEPNINTNLQNLVPVNNEVYTSDEDDGSYMSLFD